MRMGAFTTHESEQQLLNGWGLCVECRRTWWHASMPQCATAILWCVPAQESIIDVTALVASAKQSIAEAHSAQIVWSSVWFMIAVMANCAIMFCGAHNHIRLLWNYPVIHIHPYGLSHNILYFQVVIDYSILLWQWSWTTEMSGFVKKGKCLCLLTSRLLLW